MVPLAKGDNRQPNLKVPQEEIQRRFSVWKGPEPHYDRGFGQLFIERILQANQGCDLDFLRRAPERGRPEEAKARRAAAKLPVGF